VAFDNDGLLGDHIHIFGNVPDLGKWGKSISAMVIVAGRWELFDEENLKNTRMYELGPGVYLHVKDHGIKDNSISSIRLVSPVGRLPALPLPWLTGACRQGHRPAGPAPEGTRRQDVSRSASRAAGTAQSQEGFGVTCSTSSWVYPDLR
jgi:Beta/Gamma crystallin